jgi:beta-galactosidase
MRCSPAFCVAVLAALALAAPSPAARHSLTLSSRWSVQPASAPDRAPRAGDWGVFDWAEHEWRDRDLRYPDTSWGGRDRAEIDSLWFEQAVTVPLAWRGQKVIADFHRVEGDAIVFLNGRRVGERLRPGGEVELTGAVRWGEVNRLAVFVTRDYTGISRGFEQDPLRRAAREGRIPRERWHVGITGPVVLSTRPPVAAVTDVFAVPSWRRKELALEVEVETGSALRDLRIEARVADEDGRTALELPARRVSVPAGRSTHRVAAAWADPVPWELDDPYLYTAEVRLLRSGRVVDEAPPVRFGFREVWTEGRRLVMNGHPSRWRLAGQWGLTPDSLPFFRLMGANVFHFQPHSQAWWSDWADSPLLDDSLLDALDETGSGATIPLPTINHVGGRLRSSPEVRREYREAVRYYQRRYRNHPSILAWTVGMNYGIPLSNIAPRGMGVVSSSGPDAKARVIEEACDIAREQDPTRLVFSHAGGSRGDISSSNVYLNWVPLQEREEWPMAWAGSGSMPYAAVEFGPPYSTNAWRGPAFLLTEYLAIYQGDEAYATEGRPGLARTLAYGAANRKGHGALSDVDLDSYPGLWELRRLFVRNTDRAWRTWGVNGGWLYWNLDLGYGDPPGFKPGRDSAYDRYGAMEERVTARPEWVNPNFDIHAEGMQPLLAYLAGWPLHTDKTHAFFPGQPIRKQVALVWDGARARELAAEWTLSPRGGAALDGGAVRLAVPAGGILLEPIETRAPRVGERTPLLLRLVVRDGEEIVAEDVLDLQAFPPVKPMPGSLRVALHDPEGRSRPWIEALGVRPVPWRPGASLEGVDLLVVGREALRPGSPLPYAAADVSRGLRVVVLEQRPEIWEAMGFRSLETMPRYVFARDAGSPVLAGLEPEDLVNWRGSPDLLPEGEPARSHRVQRAPKWTNRHAVAPVVLQVPQVTGFTPLLVAEFDLDYSPLLEWRHGRGAVWFCTLALSERVGDDPAATLLARNLLEHAARAGLPFPRRVVYAGGPGGWELVGSVAAGAERGSDLRSPGETLAVLGEGETGIGPDALHAFLAAGGRALVLPRDAAALQAEGLAVRQAFLAGAAPEAHPLLRAVGPNVLRWRTPLRVALFTPAGRPDGAEVLAGGAVLHRPVGGGEMVHLQVAPRLLTSAFPEGSPRRVSLGPAPARVTQLVARLLTNLGAGASPETARRLATLRTDPFYREIPRWTVLGTHRARGARGADLLDEAPPRERALIASQSRPGTPLPAGGLEVRPGGDGHVDLQRALRASGPTIAWLAAEVESEAARTARLRFGADSWLVVWVNGRTVYRTGESVGPPRPNRHQVNVPLRAGENRVLIEVAPGATGFGFWANLSGPGSDVTSTADERTGAADLYPVEVLAADPYEFVYW